MIDHFKNGHKRTENCHASVLLRKRKKTILQTDNSKRYALGAPAYCPQRIEGDDDVSIAAHKQPCIEQARLMKKSRKINKCDMSIGKLIPERRKEIINGTFEKLMDIKISYPLLFDEDEVCCYSRA